MARSAVDNDVLIKLSAYRLLAEGLGTLGDLAGIGVLGVARFVVPSAIDRHRAISEKTAAAAQWSSVADVVEPLEPSPAEVDLAAEMEELATRMGQPLDSGESQLCAIAIARTLDHLATGDKRAIVAAERMLSESAKLKPLTGRILCLEQLIVRLIARMGSEPVRDAVCLEPRVDRALAACLSCASRRDGTSVDDSGLCSYIADLKRRAPTLLAAEPPC